MGPLLLFVLWLGGCASTSGETDNQLSIFNALDKKGVVTVPYSRSEQGLFIIPIGTENGPLSFLIDTGATRSALFKGEANALIAAAEDAGVANIHGLVNSGRHPIVKIAELKLGQKKFLNLPVAILPEREGDVFGTFAAPAGLIGMDVMASYNLYVDATKKTISFVPQAFDQVTFPTTWTPVILYHNPRSLIDRDLHFFDIRVGNHLMPAILDSGSEFNVINWEASVIPELRRWKRRLKSEWEVQGAVGEFDPAMRITVKGMRAGQKRWGKNEFIVMNFDHMETLGYQDEPLVVAGSNIFGDNSFFINFASNEMWIKEDIAVTDMRTGENNEIVYFDR